MREMRCRTCFLSGAVLFVLLSFPILSCVGASSQMWSQTYGGAEDDTVYALVKTSGGGYALAGSTKSFFVGNEFFWLVKTDKYGTVQWNQSYGKSISDTAYALVETSDGGFALAGGTWSFGSSSYDFWLVKTDAYGNMEWSQTYGGTDYQIAYSLVQAGDGGYAILGYMWPSVSGTADFWLIKTDKFGNVEWNQTYNKANYDFGYSLVETSDGGFALAGGVWPSVGVADFWLAKTDRFGNMEWNQTYKEERDDGARALVVTSDGGFALTGGGCLVKTDASGNMEWNQTYGRGSTVSLVQMPDGGYALAGYIDSYDTEGNDFWLVKTDADGDMKWNQTYGGASDDRAYALVESSDGGYVLAGSTESFGAGKADLGLIKTDEYGDIPEFPSWTILPLLFVAGLIVITCKRWLPKKE
jgi:hypothetical protein